MVSMISGLKNVEREPILIASTITRIQQLLYLMKVKYNPDYLSKHKLWDSDWLRKKYKGRFTDSIYFSEDIIYDNDGEFWDVL